ncbi:MAG: Gfo/Idh/MocA family oxidoreductase [Muribaculaceae bacterium]|nr:Gfo/Idh/MocA family oxidoreductase [Muribaculaceae bacterium]
MTEISDSSRKPTSIVAIGVGNRMRTYMQYVAAHPDEARLVAVVEPDPIRRNAMADRFNIPSERRFNDYHEFFKNPVKADAAIICTPERYHFEPCMEAIRCGMHVLLEKPVAQTYEQCRLIDKAARQAKRVVGVCHVLRYHPAFRKVKELVSSGRFGRIMTISHVEDIGIDRTTHSYVRGTMNTEEGNNPLLMAKCCHDIDFLSWLTDASCSRLSSFGNRIWFRRDNAPAGSATRCVSCSVEKDCPYSAVDLYQRRHQWIANFDVPAGDTIDAVIQRELEEGPYGRCVFHCDNDLVDNQVLTMHMDDGSIITLMMDIFTLRDGRSTDIKMTHGEIVSNGIKIVVTDFRNGKREVYDYTEVCKQPYHAGADLRIVDSFLKTVRDEEPDIPLTTITDALRSHRLCFEAERSRRSGSTVTL